MLENVIIGGSVPPIRPVDILTRSVKQKMDQPTQPIQRIVRDRPRVGDHVPVVHPMQAIRSFCVQCLPTASDVRDCCATTCSLWPYRFGKGYQVALREGLVVDPNSGDGHLLRDLYRGGGTP